MSVCLSVCLSKDKLYPINWTLPFLNFPDFGHTILVTSPFSGHGILSKTPFSGHDTFRIPKMDV